MTIEPIRTDATEHVDVLVVGAGISGVGAGYHLGTQCPDRSFTILEGRADLGGTWDLFRYPGIRSDSDMYTLGYSFRPWIGDKTMADGPSIQKYVRETAQEFEIDQHIRYNHQAISAAWCAETAMWTVTVQRTDTDETVVFTCGFLFMCSGYYSYKGGYDPEIPGRDRFAGPIIHPQTWPDDLDYTNKSIVVIGSGATAVTLVPALAPDAQHVTMLQRSPSYVLSQPAVDKWARRLRKVLPSRVAFTMTRWKHILQTEFLYRRTRSNPEQVRSVLLGRLRHELGPDFDVDTHFTPTYDPWDQRLCVVPDGDLFTVLKNGTASVVTDTIATITETGILLESGDELSADIIVTATGLQLVTLGEMEFTIDGEVVDFSQTWTYNGLAYSGVPNLVSTFGYINASWTLRVDLTCEYVCRLLNHMSETGTTACTPHLRPSDSDMLARSWIDDFSSGYMQRMMPLLPKQGDREPWLNTQRYVEERRRFRKAPIDDGVMQFAAPVRQK